MLRLTIPHALTAEFATVLALWKSSAETRRTDALLLAWVKYEKQLRRLFCFLVFQHPAISEDSIEDVISAMAKNRNLNPETFLKGIKALGVPPVPVIMGADYDRLERKIQEIKDIRNKLMHGQITGQDIKSSQLERHVLTVVDWVACLAKAADSAYGYDGLKRNTFRAAKSAAQTDVMAYPFGDVEAFTSWLRTVAK